MTCNDSGGRFANGAGPAVASVANQATIGYPGVYEARGPPFLESLSLATSAAVIWRRDDRRGVKPAGERSRRNRATNLLS